MDRDRLILDDNNTVIFIGIMIRSKILIRINFSDDVGKVLFFDVCF